MPDDRQCLAHPCRDLRRLQLHPDPAQPASVPHRLDDFENAVLFQYEAPQAKHVNLCGNWADNTWCGTQGTGRFDQTIGAMQDDDGDGVWQIVIPLKAGRDLCKSCCRWGIRWEYDQNNPLTEDDGLR